jgi:hypothetical protein
MPVPPVTTLYRNVRNVLFFVPFLISFLIYHKTAITVLLAPPSAEYQ